MDSSRRGGASPPSQAPPRPPRSVLTLTLEQDIVPRLIQAHVAHEFSPDLATLSGRPISAADVLELARRALLPDDSLARDWVWRIRERGVPVEVLLVDLLPLASRHLGVLWEQDLCTFSDVTVGVGRLQQILRDISPGLLTRPHGKEPPLRVLLLPTPGEQHSFGLLTVAEFFRSAGWQVAGGPVPTLDPAAAVRRDWYDVVGFSLAAEMHLAAARAAIAAVRKASVNPRVGILVGGPLFTGNPELAATLGADAVAINGSLAPEIAAKLVETRVSPS